MAGTERTVTIEVEGEPVGWPRPRARSMGKHATVYTPKGRWHDWKNAVMTACLEQYDDAPMTGPIEMTVVYRMPRPKGHWGTGKNSDRIRPSAPRWWHTQTPDRDNLDKGTKDGITKARVWADDCQVCHGPSTKIWCPANEHPGATITIRELAE